MGSRLFLLTHWARQHYFCGTFKRTITTTTDMNIRFDGKIALVTGAGKGIGRLVTLKLAEAGAKVVAVSRTQSDLDALKKQHPDKIETLSLDVTKWDATREALKGIGPIDLLVNSAGIMEVKELGQLGEQDVDKTLNINVKAMINITQMIANGMISRGTGGSIVNLSSILGAFVIPTYSVYCASKGAVHQLTRTMAAEYGPHKIRVNSVNPTAVRTAMAEKEGLFDPTNEFAKNVISRTPLKRFAGIRNPPTEILRSSRNYSTATTTIIITTTKSTTTRRKRKRFLYISNDKNRNVSKRF